MKRSPLNQNGFIPLLLTILAVVIAVIYLAYIRVGHVNH